jgi:NAD(P)-dependent dehydrogenase (short-subunit alcohol dehydrogenase family)
MAKVLVTGANRGIGLELVRQYAANGWSVVATARDPEKAAELHKIAKHHPRQVEVVALDVTSEAAVEQLAEQLDGRAIDLLLNNAATYPRLGVQVGELNYDSWSDTLEANLFGVLRVTEALLENVATSGRKQIAAISSGMASLSMASAGSVAQAGTSYQYRTSKAALNMAMVVLSKELAPRGISVAIISPGWVKTDMGGAQAAITPEVSVAGIRKVLSQEPMEISGKFLSYDGTTIPW